MSSRKAAERAASGTSDRPNMGSATNSGGGIVLEQLNILREFVGKQSGYSETDLLNCLKQSGFNVSRAGEMILTGEWDKHRGPRIVTAGTSFTPNGRVKGKSAFYKMAQLTTSPPRSTDRKPAPRITNAAKSQIKAHPSTLAATSRSRKPSVSLSPNALGSVTACGAELVDLTESDSRGVEPSISTHSGKLFLCRRWLSDGVITCRQGRAVYHERLTLSHSLTGYGMVRFKAKAVEGRLPESLAALLTPLLRAELIEVQAESLMSDDRLILGSSLPISVAIYLTRPRAFFETMSSDTNAAEAAASQSHYFANKENFTSKKRHKKHVPIDEAAFLLLQWAQHGDVPDFTPPTESSTGDVTIRQRDSAPSTCTVAKSESDLEIEEEYEESVDGSTAQGEELNSFVEDATDKWSSALPEAEDPVGFADHVRLRHYQKQALYFMNHREQDGESREQLDEQIQLLQEMSTMNQTHSTRTAIHHDSLMAKDISCECGPVIVSDEAQAKSVTLDGNQNPVAHPLWQRRFLATIDMSRSICFYVNELLGIATHIPPKPPRPCSGGILADAMGLGKTVMLMALILKSKNSRAAATHSTSSGKSPSTTLVVAKLSLLAQWEEEIKSKTNLSYRVYYGVPPKNDCLDEVDVVITTYGTMQGELKRKNPVLLDHHWLRVILDEAHCIRSQKTLASKACCQLTAEHRWCVSGTIIQNSLDDVYGIMKFLRHEPWCFQSFWNAAITTPFNAKSDNELNPDARSDSLHLSLNRVRRLLSPVMLRRTKDSVTTDGKPILTLPPVETKIVNVELFEGERDFYNAILARSMEAFDGFIRAGTAAKSYIQIFSMLTRLRQVCDHIALTVKSQLEDDEWMASARVNQNENNDDDVLPAALPAEAKPSHADALGKHFLDSLLQKFCEKETVSGSPKRLAEAPQTPSKRLKVSYQSKVALALAEAVKENSTHMDQECAICLEQLTLTEAVITPCAHIFCRDCLVNSLRARWAESNNASLIDSTMGCPDGKCPMCQSKVEAKQIIALTKSNIPGDEALTSTFLTKTKPASSIKHEVRETKEGNPHVAARQILENAVKCAESSKLKAVMEELTSGIWRQDPGSKVLIFSHFLGFLDLLGNELSKSKIPFYRLDGSLTLKERMRVLEEFRLCKQTERVCRDGKDDEENESNFQNGTVLLMSMAAGGEGLNITSASTCFIIEPWWNSAKEDQCVNRIHRFGQQASIVRVRKFIVQDSVEERIVALQKKKAYVAGEVYKANGRIGDLGNGRLGLDDFRLIFQNASASSNRGA